MSTAAQRAAFRERTRQLVDLLLQERAEREAAEEARWPRIVAIEIHPDLKAGVLEEGTADSESRRGHEYRLVRTASGWQHLNTDCWGWQRNGVCRHVEGRNMEQALVPSNNVLALIDAMDDDEIVTALSGAITKSWVYEFSMNGQPVRGLSALGVDEACGELAKHGEAIRAIDLKIEFEDLEEARFLVQAGRYAISAEGREILLDVTFRGKRQSKRMKVRERWLEDPNWYEKGVTKAVRNAKNALLPEYAKATIMAKALGEGRVRRQDQARPANIDKDGVIQGEKPALKPAVGVTRGQSGSPVAAQEGAQPPPACPKGGQHGDEFFDDAGVMRCGKCKAALQGPDSVLQPQQGTLA